MPWKSLSNMNPLIATDIFGRTAALEALADELSSSSGTPLIVDPYRGVEQHFDTESDAYAAFQRTIGLDAYIQIVQSAVQCATQPMLLIGFSVGASAVWALSGESAFPPGTRAVCFYGSQIRHFTGVAPRLWTELIFPRSETHFDVTRLMAQLSTKAQVHCHQAPHLHGFMNRLSDNFSQAGYDHYLGLLRERTGARGH
jgi:dienelactone hydrolase